VGTEKVAVLPPMARKERCRIKADDETLRFRTWCRDDSYSSVKGVTIGLDLGTGTDEGKGR
jgi:hypothetical protein